MLVRADLKLVAQKRLRDANVLLQKKRYSGAVYLGGYTVELLLKRRICISWGFHKGFPETEVEFDMYRKLGRTNASSMSIKKLQQIKCHDLNRLLLLSGKGAFIQSHHESAWQNIEQWKPEWRYSAAVVRKAAALTFLKSCHLIIQNI